MRTTVTLDDEATAAVNQLRERESVGVSEAVNRLIHAGAVERSAKRKPPRELPSHHFGDMIDVTNVAEAIEQLEGPYWR